MTKLDWEKDRSNRLGASSSSQKNHMLEMPPSVHELAKDIVPPHLKRYFAHFFRSTR